jgi:hypothetical protein
MRILCIGDVVGKGGCEFLRSKLPTLKKLKGIDMTICNGENSSDGNGITPASAEYLFTSGVDVITLGNHTFRRKEFYSYLDENEYIIRPANFPEGTTPGKGYCVFDMGRISVAVINLMGNSYMGSSLDCPFRKMDDILKNEAVQSCNVKIVDFHAEATGEKRAMGFYLDGKVSAVFGTHTHVQTADNEILPKGTGYITDVGMTGAIDSVLGVKPEIIISSLRNKLPERFDYENGPCKMDCIIFDVNEKTGLTENTEIIEIR